VGDALTPLVRTPDAVDLFLYSAAVWLPHRIHYDLDWTTRVEGHAGLLVQGPLQGVYLSQLLRANFGRAARLTRLRLRHTAPVHAGTTLTCGGEVTAATGDTLTCALWVDTPDTRVTTGDADLRLP
jgi:hydroxyacyl-ACP dehydratase HTD2-like protein with hotdog domain